MTRLALLCTRLIEAGWLLAAVLTPLYFNVFTTRVFEPDKITFLRCIVLVMLLAQAVILVEKRRLGGARPAGSGQSFMNFIRQDVFLIAVIVYGAVYLLSSVTSIDSAISLGGSHARLQGLYSLFSYLVIFGLIAANMRHLTQVSRLVTVMVLTGFVAALYGVLQATGQDPLPWGGDVTTRVSSTMGNPIFIGAYIVMVLPLAIGRALAGRLPDAPKQIDRAAFGRAIGAVGLILVLLTLLLVANGSSPQIWFVYPSLLTIIAGILVWTHEQLRRSLWWQVSAFFGVVAAVQLLGLGLSQSRGPLIGLVAGVAAFALLWTWKMRSRVPFYCVVGAISVAGVFLVIFNLPSSPLSSLRSVPYFGRFGQLGQLESGTGRVRVLIWQGTREIVTTWPQVSLEPDSLQFLRPLLGYGPETMAYAANKVYLPELGQVEARTASPDRNHQDLLDHLVMTGLVGLAAYLLVVAAILVAGIRLVFTRVGPRARLMFASFVGALVAHLIESQVGIAIAATLTYFWIIAGLIYVCRREVAEAETKRVIASESGDQPVKTPVRQTRGRTGRSVPAAGGLAGASWFAFAIVAGAGFLVILSIVALAYDEVSTLMIFSFVGSWVGFVLLAWLLVRQDRYPGDASSGGWTTYVAYPVLMLLVLGVVVQNLNQLSADVYHKQGQLYDRTGRYAEGVVAYQRAVNLAPEQDYYALFVGRSFLELAKRARPGGPTLLTSEYDQLAVSLPRNQVPRLTREDFLAPALISLHKAQALRPLNTDHYANLARLSRYWGDQGDLAKLGEATDYYSQATQLSPHTAHLFSEWALTELARNDLESARDKSQRAISLDPKFASAYVVAGDIELSAERVTAAWQLHLSALNLDPLALNDSRFTARVTSYLEGEMAQDLVQRYGLIADRFPSDGRIRTAYAFLLSRNGQPARAADQYKAIIAQDPSDWMAYRNLALNYNDLGDFDQAIKYMSSALEHAPTGEKPAIQALVNDLKQRASSG